MVDCVIAEDEELLRTSLLLQLGEVWPGLRIVAEGVNRYAAQGDRGVLLITHYTRILRYIEPTHVHVFVGGQIVAEGGKDLAEELEIEGYDKYLKAVRL